MRNHPSSLLLKVHFSNKLNDVIVHFSKNMATETIRVLNKVDEKTLNFAAKITKNRDRKHT